jgi:glutaredoxin
MRGLKVIVNFLKRNPGLRASLPSMPQLGPTIVMNKKACDECERFIQAVEEKYDVTFRLVDSMVRTEYSLPQDDDSTVPVITVHSIFADD